jgi:hypothetical protein
LFGVVRRVRTRCRARVRVGVQVGDRVGARARQGYPAGAVLPPPPFPKAA